MQCYRIFFVAVDALHVSGGFSAHHQELKTVRTASGICRACLLLPLAQLTPLHSTHYRHTKHMLPHNHDG